MQAEGACLDHDGRRFEISALKQNVRAGITNSTFQPTHDACQSQRSLAVTNCQNAFIQGNFRLVQQDQPFTFPAPPHNDFIRQLFKIECMHGLAEFKQYIVGNVHHRADAA